MLTIPNLSKTYPDGVRALRDVCLDEDSISFDVLREQEEVRKTLGYLPQEFGVYPRISLRKMLDHFAVLKGVGGATAAEPAERDGAS